MRSSRAQSGCVASLDAALMVGTWDLTMLQLLSCADAGLCPALQRTTPRSPMPAAARLAGTGAAAAKALGPAGTPVIRREGVAATLRTGEVTDLSWERLLISWEGLLSAWERLLSRQVVAAAWSLLAHGRGY